MFLSLLSGRSLSGCPLATRCAAPGAGILPGGNNGFAIPGLRLTVLDQQFSIKAIHPSRADNRQCVETFLIVTEQSRESATGIWGRAAHPRESPTPRMWVVSGLRNHVPDPLYGASDQGAGSKQKNRTKAYASFPLWDISRSCHTIQFRSHSPRT